MIAVSLHDQVWAVCLLVAAAVVFILGTRKDRGR